MYVWVEEHGRADVVVATAKVGRGDRKEIDPKGAVRIPIELKTIGTWWGTSPGAIRKAYEEPRKKRLLDDLKDCRTRRRDSSPFSCVALLVTHRGAWDAPDMQAYIDHPKQLASKLGLELALDEKIEVPQDPDWPASAHQLLWLL